LELGKEIAYRLNKFMKTLIYQTVSGNTAVELDKAVNIMLEEGCQLYGHPYLSDQRIEGAIAGVTFHQAVTMERETGDKKAAVMKTLAERIEIKELKMTNSK
jgi:hypothetical protein